MRGIREKILRMLFDALESVAENGFKAVVNGIERTLFPRIVTCPMDYHEACAILSIIKGFCTQCACRTGTKMKEALRKRECRNESACLEGVDRATAQRMQKTRGCHIKDLKAGFGLHEHTNPAWRRPALILSLQNEAGIYGIAYPDKLHTLWLGLVKYHIVVFLMILKRNDSLYTAELRARNLGYDLRHIHFPSNKDLKATLLKGVEYLAILLSLPILAGSDWSLIPDELRENFRRATDALILISLSLEGLRSYNEEEWSLLIESKGEEWASLIEDTISSMGSNEGEFSDDECDEVADQDDEEVLLYMRYRPTRLHFI